MFVCKHSPCVFIVAVTSFDPRAHSSVAGWDGTPQTVKSCNKTCLIYWRTSVGVTFRIFRAWHHIYHFTLLHSPKGLKGFHRIPWVTNNLGDTAEIWGTGPIGTCYLVHTYTLGLVNFIYVVGIMLKKTLRRRSQQNQLVIKIQLMTTIRGAESDLKASCGTLKQWEQRGLIVNE